MMTGKHAAKMQQEQQERRKVRLDITLIILFFALVLILTLILLYSAKTYTQVQQLKTHRSYLKEQNISIQSWMTVRGVSRTFNLSQTDVLHILNATNSTTTLHSSIQTVCTQRHLNCTDVVGRLNGLVFR